MDLNTIIYVVTTIGGIMSSSIGFFYFDNKKKENHLAIEMEIQNLKDKLKLFYYPVHFRLLRLNYARYHLKYLKNIFSMEEIIKIEEEMVLNVHKEILDIIVNFNYLNEVDENMNNLILEYINHATLYINLRKFKIYKMPAQYGCKFPIEFSKLIENNLKTLKIKYDEFIGKKITNKLQINKNRINNNIFSLCKKRKSQEPETIVIHNKYINNKYDDIIKILKDPDSAFNKNLNEDVKNIIDKRTSGNNSEFTIDGVPNLNTVFKDDDDEIVNYLNYVTKFSTPQNYKKSLSYDNPSFIKQASKLAKYTLNNNIK